MADTEPDHDRFTSPPQSRAVRAYLERHPLPPDFEERFDAFLRSLDDARPEVEPGAVENPAEAGGEDGSR